MQFPKFTPLQSRFAASLIATLVLVIIYLSLSPYHFAYAAELDSVTKEDHNHHWLLDDDLLKEEVFSDELSDLDQAGPALYEPEFFGTDRGIIGRADDGTTTLSNNGASSGNLTSNSNSFYVFPNASLFGPPGEKGASLPPALVVSRSIPSGQDHLDLRRAASEAEDEHAEVKLVTRQTGNGGLRTAYISINVCSQPNSDGTNTAPPPQLTLYVSTSQSNQKPSPSAADNAQAVTLTGGFATYAVNASGDIFIGVHAPTLPSTYTGGWSYEVAASIDASYHNYNDQTPFLFLVDSDSDSALFLTDNLTQADPTDEEFQQLMEGRGPFTMFTFPMDDAKVQGIQNSYCALRSASSESNFTVESSMTTRGDGGKPKEQLYVQALRSGSAYYGVLAMAGSSNDGNGSDTDKAVIGGGGQVWQALNFTTKSDGNCQLLFNLSFCSDVAYAVPSNPQTFNASALAQLYDNYTAGLYQNFNYSLQQIPCETASTAQYSLARNCTNCATDYKNWLCAVTIPRCEDFSSQEPYLQPRNIAANFINGSSPDSNGNSVNATLRERLFANSSRNSLIDEQIRPGPYKELLPCEDLCHSLVQSCPAKLGFACPLPGLGLEYSYGKRTSQMTCSYFGAIHSTSLSTRTFARPLVATGSALLVSILVAFFS